MHAIHTDIWDDISCINRNLCAHGGMRRLLHTSRCIISENILQRQEYAMRKKIWYYIIWWWRQAADGKSFCLNAHYKFILLNIYFVCSFQSCFCWCIASIVPFFKPSSIAIFLHGFTRHRAASNRCWLLTLPMVWFFSFFIFFHICINIGVRCKNEIFIMVWHLKWDIEIAHEERREVKKKKLIVNIVSFFLSFNFRRWCAFVSIIYIIINGITAQWNMSCRRCCYNSVEFDCRFWIRAAHVSHTIAKSIQIFVCTIYLFNIFRRQNCVRIYFERCLRLVYSTFNSVYSKLRARNATTYIIEVD